MSKTTLVDPTVMSLRIERTLLAFEVTSIFRPLLFRVSFSLPYIVILADCSYTSSSYRRFCRFSFLLSKRSYTNLDCVSGCGCSAFEFFFSTDQVESL